MIVSNFKYSPWIKPLKSSNLFVQNTKGEGKGPFQTLKICALNLPPKNKTNFLDDPSRGVVFIRVFVLLNIIRKSKENKTHRKIRYPEVGLN